MQLPEKKSGGNFGDRKVFEMKKLRFYKENGEFVIERVNEFNHATKRYSISEEGFKEGLMAYKRDIDDYVLEISKEIYKFVVKFMAEEEF